MLVEFWDRTRLFEQEAIIGRHKVSGAPLGHRGEHDEPDFAGGTSVPPFRWRLASGVVTFGRTRLGATASPEAAALVESLRLGLAAAADPVAAPGMRAYLKSTLPYRGVRAPACRKIFTTELQAHPLPDRAAWLSVIDTLWDQAAYREERYAALAVARHRRYSAHRTPDVLPLYRHLVVTGAWWDVVDDVATHLVGPLLLDHPAEVGPVVRAWATDEDRWLRRTAVICQVGAKERTDVGLLAHAVDANLDDRDFFLRKAIGWALRQHARTDREWVRSAVAERAGRLSPLSRREALKHLGPVEETP